jgi:2-polyprenyl-3-methyl-5-hydroxy-6-metoxy-1,4-benzoquinol methylase
VCGSQHTTPWKPRSLERELRPEDFRITDLHYGATLALRHCGDCDFIFAEGEEVCSLVALYEQLSDPEYEQTQDTRRRQMRWLLDKVREFRPQARALLDVGAGTGLLVAQARGLGLDAIGVEPSHALVEAAATHNGVELLQGTFPHAKLQGRKFDVITLVDVIEHVSRPVELLRECAQALSPDGIVVAVTPDVRSIAARLLGKRWWHFRVAHVGYFSRRSMKAARRAAGLREISVFRAKWFFRVRYLAERLSRYLPLGWMNRRASRPGWMNRLYGRVVAVNLHDSTVIILARIA